MSTNSYTKTRFSADDTALDLIDHQSGIMQLVHDYSPAEFHNNVMALAKRCSGMHHLRDKIMHGRKRSYTAV